jgi:hypothetical protein
MLEREVVFYSPFDTRPWRGRRDPEAWTEKRLAVWRCYTLPSILRQADERWQYWLVCSDGMREVTHPHRRAVECDPRVRMVYQAQMAERLRSLPPRQVYAFARIDSDDLYHPQVVNRVRAAKLDRPLLQFNRGFALCAEDGRLYHWQSRSSPFYVQLFGPEGRSLVSIPDLDHSKVAPRARCLGPGHFCVLIHSLNTTTSIRNVRPHGEIRSRQLRRRICRQFGIEHHLEPSV